MSLPDREDIRRRIINDDQLNDVRVNAYGHFVTNVPPYVLDTLSSVHYKDQLNNANISNVVGPALWHTNQPMSKDYSDEVKFNPYSQDDYINRLGNNWHNLLTSVRDPQLYYDTEVNNNVLDDRFHGTWEGDQRLREALMGGGDGKDLVPSGSGKGGDEKFKRKSKAGYWFSDENRKTWGELFRRILYYNAIIPLISRLLLVTFCCCALGMACTIFRQTHNHDGVLQQPLTIMAICVQLIALAYLLYIAYDEFTGKPLGLRNASDKLIYILLDLIFIIFSLANLSLAFNTLYDNQWVCDNNPLSPVPQVGLICRRQRALAAFLFLVITFWVIGFIISLAKVVVRIHTQDRPSGR